jgi:hypothetical protein
MKDLFLLPKVLLLGAICLFSFVATTPVYAQPTIYEQAEDIRAAIDSQAVPIVLLNQATSPLPVLYSTSPGEASSPYGRLVSESSRPLVLSSQGYYTIHEDVRYNFTVKNLDIYYGKDTLSISANLLDTIYIQNWANYLSVTVRSDSIVSQSVSYNPAFAKIYALIGNQVEGLRESPDRENFYVLQKAFLPFEKNPFIGGWLEGLLFSQLPYPSSQTDSTISSILSIMDALNQPRAQVLPEPSEEAQVQSLSIHAIETSYRSPVSSSTSSLQDATKSIGVKQKAEASVFETEAIIAGLSDFIVERAEEEFNIAFMERFREKLESSEYQELRTLFPGTARFFTDQLDIIQYKTLLPLAREAFTNDLQNLGINFANMLELDSLKNNLENDPTVYNISLFYEVANLAYQGLSIDTILQNTFLRLEKRQRDLFLKSNLNLATTPKARDSLNVLENAVAELSHSLDSFSMMIDQQLFKLETDFNTLLQKADVAGQGAAAARMYQRYYERSSVKADRFYKWRGREKVDQLERITYNLDGNRDYNRLLQKQPQIDKFPLYFDNPPDSVQLVAAGVDLSRKLVASTKQSTDMVGFMIDFYEFLNKTDAKVQAFITQIDTSSQSAIDSRISRLDQNRVKLESDLGTEITFWQNLDARKYRHQIGALSYLKSALNPRNDPSWIIDRSAPDAQELLNAARDKYKAALQYVEQELKSLNEASGSTRSPLLPGIEAALVNPAASPAGPSENPLITKINNEVKAVQLTLTELDTIYNSQLYRAEQNAAIFSKAVELVSHLLYCLKAPVVYDSLGNATNTGQWLSRDQFRAILRKPESKDLYLGLIYNQLQEVAGTTRLSSEGIATLTTQFIDVVNEASVYRDSLLMRKNNEKLKFVDYFPFVRLSMDLFNTLITTPLADDKILFPELKGVPIATDQALSLFENIYAKQYGFAIYNAVELYKTVTSGLEGDTTRAGKVRDNMILYGSFVANVAAAKKAEDVKSALVAAALPPGSSRTKRQNTTDVSINAYMGLGLGTEQFTDDIPGLGRAWGGLATLSVPVGLAYSHKFNLESKWSYTFFVPILDLGAVTSFRIDNEEATNSLPELSFQNVIAPGGFILANRDRTPFTFGAGIQYGPQVREITSVDNATIKASAWRAMLLFAVDVPVFNIFTRKEKRK